MTAHLISLKFWNFIQIVPNIIKLQFVNIILTFMTLWANSWKIDDNFSLFFFLQKIGFDISCKL